MASSATTALPVKDTAKVAGSSSSGRPTLKNLTRARVPRAGVIGVSIAVVSALTWKLLISDQHKRNISSFYKTYDPERDYARMKSAGVFKSLQGRERPEWLSEYESQLDDAIASLRTSVTQFRHVFDLFDKNGDGNIDANEIGQVMRSLGLNPTNKEIADLIAEVDKNGNQRLDFSEFCAFMSKHWHERDQEAELRDAFRLFDRDNSG
ncbi:unnamed protein product, partial [Adineta steineri]